MAKRKDDNATVWSKTLNKNIKEGKEEPIILFVYHLSAIQRLLNRATFNILTNQNFVLNSSREINERDDLIKIEIGMFSCYSEDKCD